MENINAYKTSDGRIFENLCDAQKHEQELYDAKVYKEKEDYVRLRLKESIYGNFFKNPFEPKKSNILPDIPLVQTLIQNTELVKEIIGHLENIK